MTRYIELPKLFQHMPDRITDSDIINPDDWEDNRCFLFHDHGFTLCVVFAPDLTEALDIAFDHKSKPLDRYRLSVDEENEIYPDFIDYLGNEGYPCDISCLSTIELPLPKRTFYWD